MRHSIGNTFSLLESFAEGQEVSEFSCSLALDRADGQNQVPEGRLQNEAFCGL